MRSIAPRMIPLFALLLVGCASSSEYRVVEGAMLGTTLHIIAQAEAPSSDLFGEAMQLDREMKASMSIFDEESLLSRLNRNETDSMDRHIRYNLTLAREIHELSEGAYDVTVKPLVDAYGFAAADREEQPNIDSLLSFVGMDRLSIDEQGRLRKEDPRVQLDFNSIAKGYTVDCLAALLEARGVENYLVDVGGEVRCCGVNRQGGPWRIGVERPVDGALYGEATEAVILLHEGAMATSGNYRRYFTAADGRKIGHTIDPKSGQSQLSRLLSATVVTAECARADAMATMLMAMGADRAQAFVEAQPELATLLILAPEREGEEFVCLVSPAMEQLMTE